MKNTLRALNVGRLGYKKSLQLQKIISDRVKAKEMPDTLVIVEHDPVYTVGIRDKSYTKEDEAKLVSIGAEFFRINRGGLITFHGPGQLVAYPILDLRNYTPSVRWYVHSLEKTIIDLCAVFGIKAETSEHTGVWVNDSKICALGIHASRYVTTHGLALNCNVDLNWFSHIVPCGIEGKQVTSLSQELHKEITIQNVLPKFKESFCKIFDCDISELENGEHFMEDIVKLPG